MRPILFPLALALTLALVAPATAGHCTTWTTDDDVVLDTNPGNALPGPRYYVAQDEAQVPGYALGVWWIYEESNGIDGLQRGDEFIDTTCHGMVAPDTIVF